MGVDTDVLLKVVDRAALREALEAYATKDRQGWIDQGREDEYEKLLAGGYDPKPLLRPLADGAVSIFTGLRFHDRDMEYSIRGWLHGYLGDALPRIHDDPRGVFVSPDVCEPRAKTYEGIIEELKDAGRFIDPSPPTAAEEAARQASLEAYLASMQACQDAKAAGDEEAFQRALAAAPEDVRAAWTAQDDMARRMAVFANGPLTFDIPAVAVDDGEDAPGAEGMPPIDPAAAMAIMRAMMGLPEGATADGAGNPLAGTPEALSAMFASMIEQSTTAMQADPLGFGRVSMLLPAAVAKALAENPPPHLDVQERTELADGSVILVTSRMGDAVMEATTVAEALAAAGIDRAAVGALPFFRESVGEDASAARTFAEAKKALGDRVELLELRTWDERAKDDKAAVTAWLAEKS
jgi:hypothetical protein